ncbi:MAG: M1 family metallopeptidase [Chloroflexi bacterium]|nr:M1 family metallopeptidase [Chloroflexota bacterium]
MRRYKTCLLFAVFFLLFSLLASCATPTPAPTPTSPPPTETPIHSTLTPAPTVTATAVPAPRRAQYTLNVVLDYAAKTVGVDETIVYPNRSGRALNDLVLAVEPNLWPNGFTINSLSLNGAPITDYTLDGQKLSLTLPAVLQPEATVTLQIQYTLNLPLIEPTNPNLSRPRIYGFTPRQINLTNWYPFIVPNVAGQWVLHDPWYYGEHLVYDAADYAVNVKSADPAVTPVIAASGAPSQNGEWTTYTLTAGRAFALSASTEFLTSSVQVGNAVMTSYYFPLYDKPGQAALQISAQALQIYSQRYGPYPHQTLAVVMGDFNDGMEFSGFFFLSRGFYNIYDGTLKNLLTTVAAHETSHQWWFEQVASDQALQPWLDEALAAYSERLFYENVDPNLVQWWWDYWPARIGDCRSQSWVDIAVYSGAGFCPYTDAVYVRGARFLDDLRARIGDETFFAFLQDYLAQENGRIATSEDFFRILRARTQIDFSDLIRQYFQNVY